MNDVQSERRERFADELSRWQRQLEIWRGQLHVFDGTLDGKLLRLMIEDGEFWVEHYERCLSE